MNLEHPILGLEKTSCKAFHLIFFSIVIPKIGCILYDAVLEKGVYDFPLAKKSRDKTVCLSIF